MKQTSSQVWVVSELYYPEETSTGYFLTCIAEGIARRYPVSVLCSQPTYAARGQRPPVFEKHNGVYIHRCWGTTFAKDRILLRLINMVTITVSIFVSALMRLRRGDCVFVVTNPPALPFAVNLVCQLRRAKCVLIIHDVYPEVLIATGLLSPRSFWVRLITWLTTRLYRRVDRIIVLGRDMCELVAQKLKRNQDKIVIISNWADVGEICPVPSGQTKLSAALDLSKKFVLQYSGNMGRTHDLEILIECARKLQDRRDIHFLIIGWGVKRRWLEETISARQMSNVTLLANRPRDELADSLNACDVGIISFVPEMAGISVPSRMYNIMAAGKPTLAVADADSELARVVQEERIGWVVPPGDVDQLVTAILEAHANPARLTEMGQRARQVAETKYSFERVIESYRSLIQGLGDPLGA